jgi:hypothetical protein
MSWSLSLSKIPREQARAASEAEHQNQGAYAVDGSHKGAMDAASALVAGVADATPEGLELAVSSYGHFNSDGQGQITVTVTVSKPVPAA